MNKEDKNERRAITFCWEVCWTYETTEKTFSISDIEKSYNLERKKLGKSAVKLTNMERLTIESRLLKIRFYNEHIKWQVIINLVKLCFLVNKKNCIKRERQSMVDCLFLYKN